MLCGEMLARRQALVFALAILLLAACGSPSTSGTTTLASPMPTATPTIAAVKSPTLTNEPTLASGLFETPSTPTLEPQGLSIAPLDEAPMIWPSNWSSDSTWLAYWTFTAAEAVDTFGIPPQGAGQLHFLNAHSGQTCPFPDQARYGASVIWQPDGTVMVAARDLTKQGEPCNNNFLSVSAPVTLPHDIDPSLSPEGQYQVTSIVQDDPDGTLSVTTQIVEVKTGQTKNVIKWRHPGGLGSLGLGGEWLTEDRFLIYETLDTGPLLIGANGDVQIVSELFGLSDKIGAESLYAQGVTISGTSIYHLVLSGYSTDAGELVIGLYHSETGEVEAYPFFTRGFSPDGKWLLLGKHSIVGGYESEEVWFRPSDPVGSPLRHLTDGFMLNLLWSSDWTKVANTAWNLPDPYASRPGIVQGWSFPEAVQLGSWKSEDYTMTPMSWSPDGKFLVLRGYVVGVQREALFVIPVP